jgi:predicted anti-sigma-YlaC factor YlaD
MRCADARRMLSARLDGEPVEDATTLATHVEDCPDCRRFETDAVRLRRAGLAIAPPGDATLPARVLAALEPDRSHSHEAHRVRIALVVVAALQAVIAIPQLFHVGSGLTAHQSRHLAVFSIALAAGFLYTALRPRRVGALLPFAAVLAVGLAITGVFDAAAGRTPIAGESTHLLEILGLVLMWMLTRLERPRPRSGAPLGGPTGSAV